MPARADPLTPRILRRWGLPDPGASKYDRGTVLVAGGARRTPGAAILAGTAALRVGAGRLMLAVAESVAPHVAVAVPESGVLALPETPSGRIAGGAHAVFTPELDDVSVLLYGSGLDDVDTTRETVERLAQAAPDSLTIVLDAFALGAIAGRPELVTPLRGRLILTPNPAELGLLVGDDDLEPERAKEFHEAALDVAAGYGAAVATQALVADPDGSAWTIDAGGPGLGTSGSGDVLAGAVAGFAARGLSPLRAAAWGTYVHAAAGDELAIVGNGVGYLAGELAGLFPDIIARTMGATRASGGARQ